MRLTVLGGSAAGVNTGAGCSGYLLESTSTRIVLDLGPGTLLELRKHTDFRRLDGIVISHFHLDHVLDVAALRFSLAYNPIAPPSPIPLWLPPGGQAQLRAFASAFAEPGEEDAFFSRVFDVEEYDPRQGLEIGDFQLRFQPTVHYIPCWAIRVSSADGSTDLGYTADTGPATPLADFFAGVGVLVSESTLLEPTDEPYESRGHLTAEEAGLLARSVGAHTLVLSHLWEEVGFSAYRRAAEAAFDGAVVLARPGAQVEW